MLIDNHELLTSLCDVPSAPPGSRPAPRPCCSRRLSRHTHAYTLTRESTANTRKFPRHGGRMKRERKSEARTR